MKWVKDAKSSAFVNVQEVVKGVTKRQITGMAALSPVVDVLGFLRASKPRELLGLIALKSFRQACAAEEDSGQWTPIVGLDCRGLEPIGFHPEVSTSGTWYLHESNGVLWQQLSHCYLHVNSARPG